MLKVVIKWNYTSTRGKLKRWSIVERKEDYEHVYHTHTHTHTHTQRRITVDLSFRLSESSRTDDFSPSVFSPSRALLQKIEILILIRVCRAQQLALRVLDKRQQTSVSGTYVFRAGEEQRGGGGGRRRKERKKQPVRREEWWLLSPVFSEKHVELSICCQYVGENRVKHTHTHTQYSPWLNGSMWQSIHGLLELLLHHQPNGSFSRVWGLVRDIADQLE